MKNILKAVIMLLLLALCLAIISCVSSDGQTGNSPTKDENKPGGVNDATGETNDGKLKTPVPEFQLYLQEDIRK